jgi:hypothetical protein
MINFDVFISYSSQDKAAADAACAALENAGVRCWIAPRDITPGTDWGEAILDALDNCRAMVLIFSASANGSPQIRREIERAVNRGVPVLPMRIEDIVPTKALAYFMGPVHWLDAMTPPFDQHLKRLAEVARTIMRAAPEKAGDADAAQLEAPAAREAPVPPVGRPTPAPPQEPKPAAAPEPIERRAEAARKAPTPVASGGRTVIAIVAVVAMLVVGFGIWAIFVYRPAPPPPVVTAGQLSITGLDIASFDGPQGGPFNPARVSFEIRATGSGFDWTTDAALPRWVNVKPNQGHLGDNGSAQVTAELSAEAQTLSPGQYEGQLIFKNLASGVTAARAVRLAVSPRSQPAGGQLSVRGPDKISFTGLKGGPFGPSQIALTLKATGSGFRWSVDEVPAWLSVEPRQGDVGADSSTELTLTPAPAAGQLSGGHHDAQIKFRNLASGAVVTRPAEITVISRPQLPQAKP